MPEDRPRTGVLKWNVEKVAEALKISVEDVREYFTDGRRVSFLLERRICSEVLRGKLAPTEGAGYDIVDSQGGRWEVRSISKDGVYFSPSYMVGSGRRFEKDGFLKKLSEIEGFILCDIESFPEIPFWIVTTSDIISWWHSGDLGVNSKISREKALRLLSK
jgi:hypothetical protein